MILEQSTIDRLQIEPLVTALCLLIAKLSANVVEHEKSWKPRFRKNEYFNATNRSLAEIFPKLTAKSI